MIFAGIAPGEGAILFLLLTICFLPYYNEQHLFRSGESYQWRKRKEWYVIGEGYIRIIYGCSTEEHLVGVLSLFVFTFLLQHLFYRVTSPLPKPTLFLGQFLGGRQEEGGRIYNSPLPGNTI